MEEKKKLIIITGPTAVGKTSASIKLAHRINAEIISADSMQVFRKMNIGTAKIRPDEMQGIRHHLIDILNPDEQFGVIQFKELARKAIDEIYSRGHIPMIVGGTGFYIQAVLYDIDFSEYDDSEQEKVREKLESMYDNNGAMYMHEYLKKFDPESAEIIHANNRKKLLHAIEYYMLTGKKISEHNIEQHNKNSPYDFRYFVITDDREKVYQNINNRVDIMMEQGLITEVKSLLDEGISTECQSMLGLGYKESADYLLGKTTYEECVEIIKRDTRHFAKKQLTWFKREKEVIMLDKREYPTEDILVDKMIEIVG